MAFDAVPLAGVRVKLPDIHPSYLTLLRADTPSKFDTSQKFDTFYEINRHRYNIFFYLVPKI